jgi:hypothetical protein
MTPELLVALPRPPRAVPEGAEANATEDGDGESVSQIFREVREQQAGRRSATAEVAMRAEAAAVANVAARAVRAQAAVSGAARVRHDARTQRTLRLRSTRHPLRPRHQPPTPAPMPRASRAGVAAGAVATGARAPPRP